MFETVTIVYLKITLEVEFAVTLTLYMFVLLCDSPPITQTLLVLQSVSCSCFTVFLQGEREEAEGPKDADHCWRTSHERQWAQVWNEKRFHQKSFSQTGFCLFSKHFYSQTLLLRSTKVATVKWLYNLSNMARKGHQTLLFKKSWCLPKLCAIVLAELQYLLVQLCLKIKWVWFDSAVVYLENFKAEANLKKKFDLTY